MPADHALVAAFAGFLRHGVFEVGHKVQRLFDLAFEKRRQGPVTHAEFGPHPVEVAVQAQCPFIQSVAHIGQPFGVLHDGIEIIAVYQPQLASIQQGVCGFFHHFNATEMVLHKITREFVMVARYVDHAAAFAHPAQEFLHHIVVRLRPIPFASELPAVDDIADQIQGVAGVRL